MDGHPQPADGFAFLFACVDDLVPALERIAEAVAQGWLSWVIFPLTFEEMAALRLETAETRTQSVAL